MSSTEFSLDSFLSDMEPSGASPPGFDDSGAGVSNLIHFSEPGYEGKIDYRIRQLSYSSILTLHQCPRKFQLNRLRTTHRTEVDDKSNITFAFGHIVGEGIQNILEGKSETEVLFKAFLGWHADLVASDPKGKKSFWTAAYAILKFASLYSAGFLDEYELVYYNGKPACELSFAITLHGGFRLRGFVDAVLRHRESGKVVVLECKTTALSNLNPATYKNSSQAIGYSVVLDVLFPDISSYEVLYLVYQTGQQEYTPIPFIKSYLQRALWIRELLLDIEMIEVYEAAEVYPMHGESCTSFGRDCEYFNTCTLSTGYLTKKCTPEEEDKTEYQIVIGLEDLLDSQLSKVGA